MKIPIWRVRWSVAICFCGCVALDFLEGDCICVSDSCSFVHVAAAHDDAAESFYMCFEEVMVEQERALFKSVSVDWWCTCDDSTDEAWFHNTLRIISDAVACYIVGKVNIIVVSSSGVSVKVSRMLIICWVYVNIVNACC